MADITLYRNNDQTATAAVTRRDGTPLPLTGILAAKLLAKVSLTDADASAVITKTLAAGNIRVTSEIGGLMEIDFVKADTIDSHDLLPYTLNITDAASHEATVANGNILLIRTAIKGS